MSMKKLLVAKLTGDIGTIDGLVEVGAVRSCNGDSFSLSLATGSTAANFTGGFPNHLAARFGEGYTASYICSILAGKEKGYGISRAIPFCR
ncbi:hypothetical protein EDC45_0214 [Mesocricetibacter intestinalis]|uniref:Uncharacterized protein n=1 Tax=Mesocricetibacter intestinalis TaxID=1521930 RepID=A0A4R6VCD8_9PAST|nr:hypothetical protein [Mesocricetibacter intestinalis]TDQ59564.1 hypothetical protein EDC45_0214 [Mesocricetibacter intestinalis]